MDKKERGIKSIKGEWIPFKCSFFAVLANISVGIVMYDAFVIPEGGMIDNFKFMSVPNHLTATNGAGHRLSDKYNVIVNGVINYPDIAL